MRRPRALEIQIITPAAGAPNAGPRSGSRSGPRTGNRVTALRWAKRLRELHHAVSISERFDRGAPDVLIALHAVKSAESIARCRKLSPRTRVVVALTGTDVYGEDWASRAALDSLSAAASIVALQPLAIEALALDLRSKARVVYQSGPPA